MRKKEKINQDFNRYSYKKNADKRFRKKDNKKKLQIETFIHLTKFKSKEKGSAKYFI